MSRYPKGINVPGSLLDWHCGTPQNMCRMPYFPCKLLENSGFCLSQYPVLYFLTDKNTKIIRRDQSFLTCSSPGYSFHPTVICLWCHHCTKPTNNKIRITEVVKGWSASRVWSMLSKFCLLCYIRAGFFQNSDHAQAALYFPNYDVLVKSIWIKEAC